MKMHTLKILEAYVQRIIHRQKTFEVRKNDRDFQVGDTIQFRIINELGEEVEVHYQMPLYLINYVLPGGQFGIVSGYCVMSIQPLEGGHNEPGR